MTDERAERDTFEPPESEIATPATDPNLDRTNDRVVETQRPITDREVVRQRADAGPADTGDRNDAALFEPAALSQFNARWSEVQTGFVDEPRRAVQQADALVSDVIKRIADSFGNERASLEQQWDRGDDVSTEDLRQALQRYRSFFSRLLTV
jgi:hypothetical protein